MNLKKLLHTVDHTQLSPYASWGQIDALCKEAVEYSTFSVCIPPSYVERVHGEYSELTICTVIGFPNGYNTSACKLAEAEETLRNGASEIDMVVNLGWVKDRRYDDVLQEIQDVKKAVGDRVLKVIIETCDLTQEEKIDLCKIVSKSGADFIKTSTGFSKGGATPEDIKLMREYCDPKLRIKAAGGISTLEDAELFLQLGADRLGSSRIVKLVKEKSNEKGDRNDG